jgi:invasion protein IalB
MPIRIGTPTRTAPSRKLPNNLASSPHRQTRKDVRSGAGSVKIYIRYVLLAAVATVGLSGPGHAQQAPKSKSAPPTVPAPAAAAEPAPAPGWAARCTSASRDAPLECAMEQTAVLSKTGQLVVLVNIRVPADTHAPVMLVQLPLGLNLPGGAKLQIDDGKNVDLQIQTCENRGCYASGTIAPDVLAAMKAGKQIKVSFQTMNKETITIPLPLTDFAPAYDKIK